MNNQKEISHERRKGIPGKKVILGITIIMIGIASVIGAVLFSPGNIRGLFRRGSAIAMESFRDVFTPSSSDDFVSEIDLTSSSFLSKSTGSDASSSEENSPVEKTEKVSATSNAKKKPYANDMSVASSSQLANSINTLVQKAVIPEVSSPVGNIYAETSSAAISGEGIETSSVTISTSVTPVTCSFPLSAPANFSRRVILNEIAWMGSSATPGETVDHAANREWIELKNISTAAVPLSGWEIMNFSEKIKISFGAGDELAPGKFFLLSRGGNLVSGVSADKAYAGILANDGDKLAVFDASCGISDFLDASSKWPGGLNVTKQTLERTPDFGWQTSAAPGGTPRAENSTGALAVIASSSSEMYPVSVAISGDGAGKVTMKPSDIVCAVSCTNKYASGTVAVLAAIPGTGVDFSGWSGGCSGQSSCSLTVDGPISVTAIFHLSRDASLSEDDADIVVATGTMAIESSSSSEDMPMSTTSIESSESSTIDTSNDVPVETSSVVAVNHMVIAAVEIAGAESSNDFVKIYNPTRATIDASGWKLRKKSSTGSDASIREFPAGSAVAPGAYFIWANSADGFAQSIDADTSSTATLAANNSVALFDAAGAEIDAVAWGTGTDQYVEGAPYPTSPAVGQILQRKSANGVMVDTDNNGKDFSL